MYMPEWPAFNMDPNRPGFLNSPEYIGLTTVQNVVEYANMGMNAPVDASSLLANAGSEWEKINKLPINQRIDEVYKHFDRHWFNQASMDQWAKIYNNYHLGGEDKSYNIDEITLDGNTSASIGLLLI